MIGRLKFQPKMGKGDWAKYFPSNIKMTWEFINCLNPWKHESVGILPSYTDFGNLILCLISGQLSPLLYSHLITVPPANINGKKMCTNKLWLGFSPTFLFWLCLAPSKPAYEPCTYGCMYLWNILSSVVGRQRIPGSCVPWQRIAPGTHSKITELDSISFKMYLFKIILFLYYYYCLMCVGFSSPSMSVHHMHVMSSEAKRSHQIPWAGATDGCGHHMDAENWTPILWR